LCNAASFRYSIKPPIDNEIVMKSNKVAEILKERSRMGGVITSRYAKEIDELRASINTLSSENDKLKLLNREIVRKKQNSMEKPSTIHSFYQNIVIPDNEQQIMHLNKIIDKLKEQVIQLAADNGKLKKENERCKMIIARYREILLEQERNLQDGAVDRGKLDRRVTKNTDRNSCLTETVSTKFGGGISAKENIRLDMILGSLKKLSRANSLKELLDCLYKEAAILIKSCRVGIFIINPNLQRLYQNNQGVVKSITMNMKVVDFVINENNNYSMKPAFPSIEAANNVIRKNDVLVIPILDSISDTNLVIQLEPKNEAKIINSKEFLVSIKCNIGSL
jgi:regulator of replication initiation timing